jgi:hypothetical protein
MKIIPTLAVLVFITGFAPGQELTPVAELPSGIKESSGLISAGEGRFWTFNDSQGEPELYLIDTLGNLLRTLRITNAWNRDWEDICKDKEGNIYIGNMGNNSNSNKDLTIFKIPDPAKTVNDSTTAGIISFEYEDQYSFPPPKDSMNFDCEAIIWYNDYIYLFTKHRTLPMATNLYRIPAESGHHIAIKLDTFNTGVAEKGERAVGDYWITAADISEKGNLLCLLSEKKLWVFRNFTGDNFFKGDHVVLDLGKSTQKEGVAIDSENNIFITDEQRFLEGSGGNLYKFEIKKY